MLYSNLNDLTFVVCGIRGIILAFVKYNVKLYSAHDFFNTNSIIYFCILERKPTQNENHNNKCDKIVMNITYKFIYVS